MSNVKTVNAVAVRDFRDAGTEKTFAKDAAITLTEGEFANYQAAGLVRKADAAHGGQPKAA